MSKHIPSFITHMWETVHKSKNRRQAPRYSPSQALEVCLGWQEGEKYHYGSAKVVNISLSGVLLNPSELPPDSQPLWIRLEDPDAPDWVEARIVEGKAQGQGEKVLRLEFRDACPYSFFKAAVNGFNSNEKFMTLPQDLKHPEWQ